MATPFGNQTPKNSVIGTKTLLQRVIVTIAFVTVFAGATLSDASETDRRKRVVVLYSFHTLMPVNADRDRGIRRALAEKMGQEVEIDVEYLDLSRYGDEEYVHDWIVLLQKKYANKNVDVVIPAAAHAIEFTLKHRADLFPNVPIVFCSAGEGLANRAIAEPNVTGVAYRFGADETIRVALDICPKAENLLVICGSSSQDKAIGDLVASITARYEQSLNIEYLVGLPLPVLLNRVSNVDPQTIILLLTYNADVSGNNYVTREVAEKVSAACPAPIFGLWDTLQGSGIVGGSLIRIEAQGEVAGHMAARVLQGEPASDIPVAGLNENHLMFDARQLRRWDIPEETLPKDSILLYREATFWEEYGLYTTIGLIVLALQSMGITGLLINRVRRRRAERALEERVRFESLLSEMTSRFVHVPPDEVSGEITQALDRISQFLDVDKALLFRISPDGTELNMIHAWMKNGEHPFVSIRVCEAPWIWGNIARNKAFYFASIADLPNDAQCVRELVQQLGLNSGIAIPLSVSTGAIGMVVFGYSREAQSWDNATVQGLSLMGEVFANVLAYEQAVKELQTSQAESRHLAGKLLTAQEDESKRLARELHDDLSQRLAASAIEAGKLEQQSAEDSEARVRLSDLKSSLVAIADDVHQISRQIHPAILDDLGLEDALRSECNGFGERYGYKVQFRCGDLPGDLPKDIALCLYRIVQEALRNIAKHAMTDAVDIVLRADTEFAYLEVRDLGCGFVPSEVHGKPGLGLASMEERVRLVRGEFTVSTNPGRGTAITVRIPLPEENACIAQEL